MWGRALWIRRYVPPKASRGAILGSSIFAVRWVGRRRESRRSLVVLVSFQNKLVALQLTYRRRSEPIRLPCFLPLFHHNLEFSVVGTLTASVSAVVLFCCTHRMLDNCSVVGVSMVGRRRSERNRYPRCSTRFSASGEFSGGAPHSFLAEGKTAADGGIDWDGIDWDALGIVSRAVAAFRCFRFCGLCFVPSSVRVLFAVDFFPSAFWCRRSVSAPDLSASPLGAAPTSLPRHHSTRRSTNRFDSPGPMIKTNKNCSKN